MLKLFAARNDGFSIVAADLGNEWSILFASGEIALEVVLPNLHNPSLSNLLLCVDHRCISKITSILPDQQSEWEFTLIDHGGTNEFWTSNTFVEVIPSQLFPCYHLHFIEVLALIIIKQNMEKQFKIIREIGRVKRW